MSNGIPSTALCADANIQLWDDFIDRYVDQFHSQPNPKFWTEEDVAYWLDHQFAVDEDLVDAIV